MPLTKGASRETISENIAREIESGRKPAQAQAIAFSTARRSAKQRTGRVPERLEPPGERRRRRSGVRTRRRRTTRRAKKAARRSRVTMR